MTAAIAQVGYQLLSCSACGVNTVVHGDALPPLPAGWARMTMEQATEDAIAATRHELCPGCRQRVTAAVNAEVVAIRGGGFG